jgi:hypothetical protein
MEFGGEPVCPTGKAVHSALRTNLASGVYGRGQRRHKRISQRIRRGEDDSLFARVAGTMHGEARDRMLPREDASDIWSARASEVPRNDGIPSASCDTPLFLSVVVCTPVQWLESGDGTKRELGRTVTTSTTSYIAIVAARRTKGSAEAAAVNSTTEPLVTVAVSAAGVGTAALVMRDAVTPTEGSAKAAAIEVMSPGMSFARVV